MVAVDRRRHLDRNDPDSWAGHGGLQLRYEINADIQFQTAAVLHDIISAALYSCKPPH